MKFLAIIALCIAAAVFYGVVHDQITARICVEYFTIGHPRLIDSDSPMVLGFFWGVVATWWVGLPLGVCLALCARLGRRPKLTPTSLVRPLIVLLSTIAVLACLSGISGYAGAESGKVWLVSPMSDLIPATTHSRFIACLWTHIASYVGGIAGGIILCIWAWRTRGKMTSTPSTPHPSGHSA